MLRKKTGRTNSGRRLRPIKGNFMSKQTRRVFLQQAAGAAAACAALPKFARADVNSKIRMAVVGFNGRGQNHIDGFTDQLVALCDVDSRVLGKAAEAFDKKHG